jgi:RecA-family ATPase
LPAAHLGAAIGATRLWAGLLALQPSSRSGGGVSAGEFEAAIRSQLAAQQQRSKRKRTGAQSNREQAASSNVVDFRSVLQEIATPILERLNMRDGAWLEAQEFPPLRYTVPGVIPEGMGFAVGPPKLGKSWLVLGVGLASASGGKALGCIAVDRRPVLYMALEDSPRRLQSRCRRLLGDNPIPPGIHFITKATPDDAMTAIMVFLNEYRDELPLVILDTLGKVKPAKRAGEDSYQVDYAIGSKLKDMADTVPGSTLLVVHHTRKAESADFIDSVSGTQGIAGSADFVLVLARKRHEDSAVLSVTGRDIPEAEYALRAVDGMVWQLDGLDLSDAARTAEERRAAAGLGDRSLDVLAAVMSAGSPITAVEVGAKLGMSNDDAGQYLRRLAAGGRIAKTARGKYVSEVSESSKTARNRSSDGINDSDTPSDTRDHVSESHRTRDSDTSGRVSESGRRVSETRAAPGQAIRNESIGSDNSDTYTAAPPGGPYPLCRRYGGPIVAGQGETHHECRKDDTHA